ncbi:hypothetical protein [Streptomyces eurythermus]|uniref:hypothetical protein n=1 Tax=Streptomyces eurythermus TaxID=42237 RepID=UPI0036F56248
MISKTRINVRVRRLNAGLLSSARARWHGRRDAAGLREFPRKATPGQQPADATAGLPPYILGLHARVRRGTARLRSRTLRAHRALRVRIEAESVRVVNQYQVRGEPAPAALARFGRMVGEWRSAAAECRQQAQQLADDANQLIACYWDAAWAGGQAAGLVDGARPAGRLPGEIALDRTWDHIDDSLLTDRWYAGGNAAAASAVARALHILDHQAAYDGAPSGAGEG